MFSFTVVSVCNAYSLCEIIQNEENMLENLLFTGSWGLITKHAQCATGFSSWAADDSLKIYAAWLGHSGKQGQIMKIRKKKTAMEISGAWGCGGGGLKEGGGNENNVLTVWESLIWANLSIFLYFALISCSWGETWTNVKWKWGQLHLLHIDLLY